jgi:hypothetical protein
MFIPFHPDGFSQASLQQLRPELRILDSLHMFKSWLGSKILKRSSACWDSISGSVGAGFKCPRKRNGRVYDFDRRQFVRAKGWIFFAVQNSFIQEQK